MAKLCWELITSTIKAWFQIFLISSFFIIIHKLLQCTEILAVFVIIKLLSTIFERTLATLDFERARATHQCGNIIMTALAIVCHKLQSKYTFPQVPMALFKGPVSLPRPSSMACVTVADDGVFASTIIYSLSQPASFSRSPITNLWECSTYRRYKVFVWP